MSNDSVAEARSKLKIVLSWTVVGLGLLFGIAALSVFSTDWLPFGVNSEGWYLRWIGLAGVALLATGFLAGSLAAPRNPKRAGVLFLAFVPATAFCLAYPEAGFLVWDKVGNGWFETPLPLTAIGLTSVFFAPLVALLLIYPYGKKGAIVTAVLAVFAILVFVFSRWTSALLPRLATCSVPFLLFGVFWLETHRFRWPILLRPCTRNLAIRLARGVATCLVIFCIGIVMAACRVALSSSLFNGDCKAKHPFTDASSANHAVFTARAVYVGLSISSRWQIRRNPQVIDPRVGDWAVGVVRERFWGIPARWPHLVLMTNFVFWKGETYFIDGGREQNFLSSLLPAVTGGIGCSRTRRIEDAVIDMRLLHQAPLRRGAIVGFVRQPGPYNSMMTPVVTPKFLAGAQIDVSGPGVATTVTTDASGIYELDGLAAGDYTIQLHVPAGQTVGRISSDRSVRKIELKSDELIESSFYLEWEKGHGGSEQ